MDRYYAVMERGAFDGTRWSATTTNKEDTNSISQVILVNVNGRFDKGTLTEFIPYAPAEYVKLSVISLTRTVLM